MSAANELSSDLQANILAHHGKRFSQLYFVTFNFETSDENHRAKRQQKALDWVRRVGGCVTSAKAQAEGTDAAVCCFYLSWEGYDALGLGHLAPVMPDNKAFEAGLDGRVKLPLANKDDRIYPKDKKKQSKGKIHAVLLVAGDEVDFLEKFSAKHEPYPDKEPILPLTKNDAVKADIDWAYIAEQKGLIKRKTTEPKIAVEWFGFRENVSQPFFFPQALQSKHINGDSLVPLNVVLVKDKGGQNWYSAGSFLALLKLEQHVAAFQENVRVVQGLIEEKDAKLAAAYIMGRHQDGSAVTLKKEPSTDAQFPDNDFSYSKPHNAIADGSTDQHAIRCPFAAHARKANPRTDPDNKRLIARRGVLFDDRIKAFTEEAAHWEEGAKTKLPKAGDRDQVGLLFMSFQSNLATQFEYILNDWMLSNANADAHVTGIDMLVGTATDMQHTRWYVPKTWGNKDPDAKALVPSDKIKPCIRFSGGEYFFAPSLSFLQRVGEGISMLPISHNGDLPSTSLTALAAPNGQPKRVRRYKLMPLKRK